MTKIIPLILFAITLAGNARASTFVGNGGNAGDIELLVTMRQMGDTFTKISKGDLEDEILCVCPDELKDSELCATLNALTPAQVNYCSEQLTKKSDELSRLLKGSKRVRFEFTLDDVEVSEARGSRQADAVANRAENEITIQQHRFLEMIPHERIFLLTHELLHFTDSDSKPLTDEGAIGPFTNKQGSRDFINSMAAATAVEAVQANLIKKYRRSLSRPRGWNKWWISYDLGVATFERAPSGSLASSSFTRSAFSFRYDFNAWGIILVGKNYSETHGVLNSSSVSEKIDSIGLGVTYKYFPFKDPLTYFGQSHLLAQATLERLYYDFNLSDAYVGGDESGSAWGESFGVKYLIPVVWNFWFSLGVSYELQNYQYNTFNVKYDMNKISYYAGVSYGF